MADTDTTKPQQGKADKPAPKTKYPARLAVTPETKRTAALITSALSPDRAIDQGAIIGDVLAMAWRIVQNSRDKGMTPEQIRQFIAGKSNGVGGAK